MVRSASLLIDEIRQSLDEVVLGWARGEDWRIELGLADSRRDLEELEKAIEEVSG